MASGPRCTLQTAISIRGDLRGGSAWAATALTTSNGLKLQRPAPSPGRNESQGTYERHRNRHQARKNRRYCFCCCCCRSALYRFPRLCYLLLYVFCCFFGGIVCSLAVTRWGLSMFDVPARLAVARDILKLMGSTVEMTHCAYTKHPHVANLPALEDQIDAATAVAQQLIDANDAALATALAATSQCLNGLIDGLDSVATATPSSSEVAALSCVGDAVIVLMPNATAAANGTVNATGLEANLTGSGISGDSFFGLPTILEQEFRSRVTSAHRDASLKLHEHRLRQLAALSNLSVDHNIAELRASVANKLGDLVSFVSDSDSPRVDASATTRQLIDADDVHQVVAGVGDAVHVMSGMDASMHDVEAQLSSLENFSLDAVANITRGERKFEYLSGFMAFQLRRTQLTLDEEFRVAQDKTLDTSAAIEAHMQEEITAIVTESQTLTKRYERVVASTSHNDGSAGVGVDEGALLGELRASHELHRLTKSSKSAVLSNSTPPPPTPSSPPPSSSPWWWWQFWWPQPTWEPKNRASDAVNSTATVDKATREESNVSIVSFLMGGAASDLQPTLERYLLKYESTRMAFLMLELAAGMLTDSLLAAPQVDVRKISAIHDISSVWDIVFGRFTVASLMVALAAHGRELISASRRVGFVGFASLLATLFLIALKSEHLDVCPHFRRESHLNSSAAVNISAPPPTERTWFMTEVLSVFQQVVREPYDALQLAQELDSHATAMFGALQDQVDAAWGDQTELRARLKSLATSSGEFAIMLDTCNSLDPTLALGLVGDRVVRQCQLASNLSASPLPNPGAPNVSAAAFTFTTSEQAKPPTFDDDSELGVSEKSPDCPLLSQQGMESREEPIARLELRYLCAAEEVAYLSLTSWLLFLFVAGVNNLVGKLVVETSSMCWWRFLNGNRVSFIGYCTEDGRVESTDALPRAIKEFSRDVWWQLVIRFVAASASIAGVVIVWFVLLS